MRVYADRRSSHSRGTWEPGRPPSQPPHRPTARLMHVECMTHMHLTTYTAGTSACRNGMAIGAEPAAQEPHLHPFGL